MKNNIRLLWIGEYTNSALIQRMRKIGYQPMSITIAQKNITDGIKDVMPIDSISGCRLPYNQGGKLFFSGERWIEKDESEHRFVNLTTIPYVEILYKSLNLIAAAKEWATAHRNERCTVIVYGLHTPYLVCLSTIKKINPATQVVMIIPDLPEYYDFNMSSLKKALKKIDLKLIQHNRKFVDKYILFADSMAHKLCIAHEKYIVMEGSVNVRERVHQYRINSQSPNELKVFLYTGSINSGYGIDILLRAFALIQGEQFRLQIAGTGSEERAVRIAAANDPRIEYLGYVGIRKELFMLQENATLMMCMIPPQNRATKYCFPSKLFEYMLSGNPTLSFCLEGIPAEYNPYIVWMKSTDPHEVAQTMLSICSWSKAKRVDFGRQAANFVIHEKNNIVQANRILDFSGAL